MPATFTNKRIFHLTSADEASLRNFAPLFDLQFRKVDETAYGFRAFDREQGPESMLSAALAHRRLFGEKSSRTIHWVHFNMGASCRDSLLAQGETGLKQAAHLYAQNREFALKHAVKQPAGNMHLLA